MERLLQTAAEKSNKEEILSSQTEPHGTEEIQEDPEDRTPEEREAIKNAIVNFFEARGALT